MYGQHEKVYSIYKHTPQGGARGFWFDFYLDYNKREWEFKSFTTYDDPVKQRAIKWLKYLKYIVFNKL